MSSVNASGYALTILKKVYFQEPTGIYLADSDLLPAPRRPSRPTRAGGARVPKPIARPFEQNRQA
jgi:hypothetical protein